MLLLATCTAVPTSPTSDPLVLINATLIDGTGAEPVADAVLVLRGGEIQSLGRGGHVPIPQDAEVLDVEGATILPGFINAHVHDAYSSHNLEAWAWAGVTTVRDEGTRGSLPELIAARDNEWNEPGHARLISAGGMITAPGGYGWLYVSSADEARRLAIEELDQGADLLKVAVEDGIAGQTNLPVLSPEAVAAIVATAHARGTVVSAHVTDARFMQQVLDAGVDDVAHVAWDPIPDAVLQQMVTRHISLVPTLTVLEAYNSLAGAQANLRRFAAMGGAVALGNDYTDIPQNNFDHFESGMPMHEIGRMAEAGMTSMQIIVAATRNAARVCGLQDELGTLEEGKAADLLVVNGDPLQNVNALTDVRLVIHRGVVISDEG
jgi:imidazolonepropionase-like amidohydrolase